MPVTRKFESDITSLTFLVFLHFAGRKMDPNFAPTWSSTPRADRSSSPHVSGNESFRSMGHDSFEEWLVNNCEASARSTAKAQENAGNPENYSEDIFEDMPNNCDEKSDKSKGKPEKKDKTESAKIPVIDLSSSSDCDERDKPKASLPKASEPNKKRRRKIPGPAGRLHGDEEENQPAFSEGAAWRAMKLHLGFDHTEDNFISRYSTQWVHGLSPYTAAKSMVAVPFMAAEVVKISEGQHVFHVTLADSKGTLGAEVGKHLVEADPAAFVPGAVLVMVSVSAMVSGETDPLLIVWDVKQAFVPRSKGYRAYLMRPVDFQEVRRAAKAEESQNPQ